jgi:hypothetical protein
VQTQSKKSVQKYLKMLTKNVSFLVRRIPNALLSMEDMTTYSYEDIRHSSPPSLRSSSI